MNQERRKRLENKIAAVFDAAMTFHKAKTANPVLFDRALELSQKAACSDDLAKWIDEEFEEKAPNVKVVVFRHT